MRQRQCRGRQAVANSPIAAAAPSGVGKAGQSGEEASRQGDACSAALHNSCTPVDTVSLALSIKKQCCLAKALQVQDNARNVWDYP